MSVRDERQKRILQLIKEKEINTQNELTNLLKSENFEVTQATVSRDINELKLTKETGEMQKYRYTQRQINHQLNKLTSLFADSVISITVAQNLLILKTYAGTANTACLFLDEASYPEILGSIAGDDTIFLATKTEEDAIMVAKLLKEYTRN
ncbi:MAG: arginine repressor [Clostridia bacterium]